MNAKKTTLQTPPTAQAQSVNHSPQNKLLQKLIQSGQFLQLCRANPDEFAQPFEFELNNGTQTQVSAAGIISFHPKNCGHLDIVLSCGVHGNETAPIEICDDYVQQILREEIQLSHRVLFLFANLPSMDIAKRFVEENMNRLFSGAHSQGTNPQTTEGKRAEQLENAVSDFYNKAPKESERQRYHYDLHTAIRTSKNEKFAVYPFRHDKPWDKTQLQILLACGINTILLSGSPTTTFSYFSSKQFDAHAFTVELGKVMPFGQNDMSRFTRVQLTLKRLMCAEDLELKPYLESDFHIYKVNQIINKQHEDFKLNFADDAPNFSDFAVGDILAEETGRKYVAEFAGEAIVFPNAEVEIGQRALLTVIPTSI
ncbi:MAG: succinylglutamate desuccinylase [Paraglaciecola sp.]|jgi:succinylglutamate desuccinylase